MEINLLQAKKELRRQLRASLQSLTPHQRADRSDQACELLRRQPLWQQAGAVILYAPMPEELDIWPLAAEALQAGKTLALPRFDPARRLYSVCRLANLAQDIQHGSFGIREPAPHCAQRLVERADLILVPGLAFDPAGHRLGRGKGYYDQLLTHVAGLTCAVAFDEQVVPDVPVAAHDVKMQRILTPTRWLET